MSYILEALKKAQAERQLGNAPTLHAPQVQAADAGVAASRKPLFIGLGAGALVVAVGALVVWHRAAAPVAPVAQAPAAADPAATPSAVPSAPASAVRAASPNTLEVSAPPAPAPVAAPAPARPTHMADAPVPARPTHVADAPAHVAPERAPATPAPRATPSPAPAAAPEDSLPYLSQLPEAARRDVPRVSFGGYMYSANPADRLLLVDKVLRHEGEEVAPGLVLEKLLPKGAVMNFRGMRYRVPY
jgi:general secretion pathway protein B